MRKYKGMTEAELLKACRDAELEALGGVLDDSKPYPDCWLFGREALKHTGFYNLKAALERRGIDYERLTT